MSSTLRVPCVLILCLAFAGCGSSPTCETVCEASERCGSTTDTESCATECNAALEPYRNADGCAEAIDALLVCEDAAVSMCEFGACLEETREVTSCLVGDTSQCEAACTAAQDGTCSYLFGGLPCRDICAGWAFSAAKWGCEAELEAQQACIEQNGTSSSCFADCAPQAQELADCRAAYCEMHPEDSGC